MHMLKGDDEKDKIARSLVPCVAWRRRSVIASGGNGQASTSLPANIANCFACPRSPFIRRLTLADGNKHGDAEEDNPRFTAMA